MGLRFRKSIKVADGVKINIGKSSAGVSLGGKYAGVNLNTKTGASVRASAPGTGVSYSKKIGSSKTKGRAKAKQKSVVSTVLTVALIAIAVIFVLHKNWDTISDKLGIAQQTMESVSNPGTTSDVQNVTNTAGADSASGTTYVINTNTKKVHKPDCRYAGEGDNFKTTTESLENLLNSGYSKCKTCMD